MSWSESLFQKAEKWFLRMDQRRRGVLPSSSAVRLDEIKTLLNYWCTLISGRSWILQESETWPAVDAERLFFPPMIEIFKDARCNRRAYFYMACAMLGEDEIKLSDLKKWREDFQKAERVSDRDEEIAALAILHDAEPIGSRPLTVSWTPESFRSLWNLWIVRRLDPILNHRGQENGDGKRNSSSKQERKKKAKEQIEILETLGDPDSENPLVHSFEKLHTTDDYKGGHKQQDGEDELEEYQDSLEDLDLRQVIRTQRTTQATLKGDFVMDLEVAESSSQNNTPSPSTFFYDEWNEGKAIYHPQWCRLEERREFPRLENSSALFDPESIRKRKRREVDQLSRCFYQMFQSARWKTRQSDGSELDLDSLVDFMSTPAEKRPEKMNVYLSRKKEISELAIVVLFDRSLSSDSWVDNRRVLDVTRESLVVIGEALKKFPLSVQLACFSSHTRNRIYYDILKDFSGDWEQGLENLANIEPSGYTRIGPGLRHAQRRLQGLKAKHKWILLLSDAKPTDFDKYEGRYGVRDVRKAIQEARNHGIGVRCLSIEKAQRMELAEMFGTKGYELLSQADQLPLRLGLLLKNLVQAAL